MITRLPGSTFGTWVTAAAVADPKTVTGLTCIAWGCPMGRQAHREATSQPSEGRGVVCLRRGCACTSFRRDINQDTIWQMANGCVCVGGGGGGRGGGSPHPHLQVSSEKSSGLWRFLSTTSMGFLGRYGVLHSRLGYFSSNSNLGLGTRY